MSTKQKWFELTTRRNCPVPAKFKHSGRSLGQWPWPLKRSASFTVKI